MSPADAPASTSLAEEVKRRRTFAIISHPDAGKTTLTEKLLLFSGMIRTAGMVGSRKNKKAASDWMSMEQERGISITASAMQFTYKDVTINVLDTPGHQDFSEDTYRTLTAADSVIMVLDGAKGIELQTRKLFEACKLRGIPAITFVNKWDLPGRDPLELMEEVEEILGIHSSAMNWPIGNGRSFRGVIDRASGKAHLYTRTSAGGATRPDVEIVDLADVPTSGEFTESDREALREEIELLEEAGNPFDRQAFLDGQVTPVFFGSAATNFGVEPLFDALIGLAPCPGVRPADTPEGEEITIDPADENFSAYIFKMQANMNPRHRDCVAFLRINSGRYYKDIQVRHDRLGRKIRLARPHSLMVSERSTLDEAYPGDIIGVINSGQFAIGDTISTRGGFSFKPLPHFQPELFARIRPRDMGKRKNLDKGLEQLVAEGAVQLLWDWEDQGNYPYVAAVGRLQFEVLQFRLEDEYGVATHLDPMPFESSGWLEGEIETFEKPYNARIVRDQRDRAMVLFTDDWEKKLAIKNNPDHRLLDYA